ncbi:uncharacterized protein LOC143861702 isoform X2 [Tasmannia lanceolata]|uniref:uncharacterized protein LOC143861702 isoform X2 n=1 Tax=Tasmannia lanceolata TaxID=3420 RepID=UPI0040629360
MAEYIRGFKEICDDWATIGQPLGDRQKVFGLLKGLGSSYESFTTTMLKPPIPSYKELVPLLQSHEMMRSIHLEKSHYGANQHGAFTVQRTQGYNGHKNNRRGRGGQHNFNSKGRGFSPANYKPQHGNDPPRRNPTLNKLHDQAPQKEKEAPVVCQICNKNNHTAIRCYQRFNQISQPEDMTQALAAMSLSDAQDHSWFPDTGASQHMTADTGNLRG